MPLVSQSEFARMCGVSRQAVLKWKSAGMLVLEGKAVNVDATDEQMQRYHAGGSPLRKTVNRPVDTRLTSPHAVDKCNIDLSTASPFSSVDNAAVFDFSRLGLEKRLDSAAKILGFQIVIHADDINLYRDGAPHFSHIGGAFEENAFCALEELRWWLGDFAEVPPLLAGAVPLLTRPFGTAATSERCNR